ncbi:hypothetical protein OVA07_01945 [Novosphingobium sp. SL115]|uniref:hypothetical protein n=1 Tax=Novosphingobium sp. SL115 TaxID=2995150 RepID=UPI00227230DA|nr:hypothetical protein [Novosphingobium sp. SL115]MCY1669767.1 hypothetical protein [Novosphingobium sp. SL115]
MQEIGQSPRAAARSSGMRGRTIAALVAGGLLAGAATAAWLGWRHGLVEVQINDGVPELVSPSTATPAPLASAPPAVSEVQLNDAATKIAMLEQRLAELNQQAMAASGNATHAEALLLAFAARRATERGQPLGWIETQLRARFGATQGAAVDRVIAAGIMPVTLRQLTEEFELLSADLAGGSPNEGTWDWLSRQMSDLFVIRHDDLPSPTPESRTTRIRAFLVGGKVEAAVAEVERLPGRETASEWLSRARAYMALQSALDQLEAAALTMTQPVVAPALAPSASALPAPVPSPTPEASAPAL